MSVINDGHFYYITSPANFLWSAFVPLSAILLTAFRGAAAIGAKISTIYFHGLSRKRREQHL